jgi:hypothetical protein
MLSSDIGISIPGHTIYSGVGVAGSRFCRGGELCHFGEASLPFHGNRSHIKEMSQACPSMIAISWKSVSGQSKA